MKNVTFEVIALFIMVLSSLLLGIAIIVFSYIFGIKKPKKEKLLPYESGMPLLDDSKKRFSVKYFIVGLLFLIFDVEVVFLYPLVKLKGSIDLFIGVELLIFLGMVFLTYVYLLKEKGFKWED